MTQWQPSATWFPPTSEKATAEHDRPQFSDNQPIEIVENDGNALIECLEDPDVRGPADCPDAVGLEE
ncbi:MAG: hypothetical protein Q9218_001426 [Villophora microphyllina]